MLPGFEDTQLSLDFKNKNHRLIDYGGGVHGGQGEEEPDKGAYRPEV